MNILIRLLDDGGKQDERKEGEEDNNDDDDDDFSMSISYGAGNDREYNDYY
jgi:hypothetical protein